MLTLFSSRIFKHTPQCFLRIRSSLLVESIQNTNRIQKYSSVQLAQPKNLLTIKKRRPKKKNTSDQSIEKSGFWNVTAVATAEEYDLDAIQKFLTWNENYRISEVFESIRLKETNFEFIHAVASYQINGESRELFIFREGSFVGWNVSNSEVDNIIDLLQNYEINGYDDSIVKDETEIMSYTYSTNNSKKSLFNNSSIYLTTQQDKCIFDKYSCSNGMVASVSLGVWEALLDKFIECIEPVTLDLKYGKNITITRKELLKLTGELYALKHKINLSSNLLDTPDFYWEREELEPFYLDTCRYFSIPKRIKVINDKIHHCIELVDLLSSHLSDRHHIRLEWMIIILIMVEVGFEFLHFIRPKEFIRGSEQS